jgi:sortase A
MRKEKTVVLLKKSNLNIFIPLLIILIGICVMLYPWFRAWRFDSISRKSLRIWEEAILNGDIAPDGMNSPNFRWTASTITLGDYVNDDGTWDEDTSPRFTADYLLENMKGIITIEKIDLKAVILKPASKHNLDISICSVNDSGKIGKPGNFVLAGHFSRIYGRHFSRLKEVGIGDIITVNDGFKEFNYRVTEMFSVAPTDVWVMEDDGDRKLITLITCDYATKPINRWIVRGEIIQ